MSFDYKKLIHTLGRRFALKELFQTIEVEFISHLYLETDNEKDNDYPFKNEMKEKTGGKLFPFCYFNGEYVGGYRQIHQNLITGRGFVSNIISS